MGERKWIILGIMGKERGDSHGSIKKECIRANNIAELIAKVRL